MMKERAEVTLKRGDGVLTGPSPWREIQPSGTESEREVTVACELALGQIDPLNNDESFKKNN